MVSCSNALIPNETGTGMWRDAHHAAADPYFLAWALGAYRRAHHLDDTGLTRFLQCSPADLPHLALCRRPDPHEPNFERSVQVIAAFARCDPERLATVLQVAAFPGSD